jgi:hypothetical protein
LSKGWPQVGTKGPPSDNKKGMCCRLKEDCVLVQGAAKSALYDLLNGKVYSRNRSAHRVQASTQQGMVKRRHRAFIDQLIELGLEESSEIPFSSRTESQKDNPA